MAQHHEIFMQRCLQLALLGKHAVAPNPMVGAVLVYEGRIIGEGYHKVFGGAHAEVECLASVRDENRDKIEKSTLYVSLEPCAHHGKTPPCTDLILTHRIPEVVIGCTDTHHIVSGRGIALLQEQGVSVITSVLEKECRQLNERFFTFHEKKRPWMMLKWAASGNGKIGKIGERVAISHPLTNRLVHKWRSESAAIMVATNTALYDDPLLTNRHWGRQQPLRILLDMHLRLPEHLKIFQGGDNVIVFNGLKEAKNGHIHYVMLQTDLPLLPQISKKLYEMQIQNVMVEGGARLLNSFIDASLWDEACVITNAGIIIDEGVDAPQLNHATLHDRFEIVTDTIEIFRPNDSTL